MRGSLLLLILVTLPFLAALGHDVYLFATHGGSVEILQESIQTTLDNPGEPGVKSLFASLGYVWTHYEPESYKWFAENSDEQTWAILNLILAQKAVVVGAVFAGFFYLLFFILKIAGGGDKGVVYSSPSRGSGRANKGGGKFKYKRK